MGPAQGGPRTVDRVERAVDNQGTVFLVSGPRRARRIRAGPYSPVGVANDRLERELQSRREIEFALKQAKQPAELTNQSKTRFLAAASHDLRQ
jgi:signal transduction histidine kinase